MKTSTPLEMMGGIGSPYTRKMRAVLRYRRIPYVFIPQNSPQAEKLPRAKVPLLPTFYLPDEAGEIVATTDSTPLIRRFEAEFEGRSVIPPNPAMAFLDELIEDYADEWLTKCMFHYRWYYEADATKARRVLPHWAMTAVSDEEIAPVQKMVGERQIGRLGVVGSNDVTAPVIEESYTRFLAVFDAQLQKSRFLFGSRPASSDFAVMGQLTCLALLRSHAGHADGRARAARLRMDRRDGGTLRPGARRRRLVQRRSAAGDALRPARRGGALPRSLPAGERGCHRARCGTRRSRDRRPALGPEAVSVPEEVPDLAPREPCTAGRFGTLHRRRTPGRYRLRSALQLIDSNSRSAET